MIYSDLLNRINNAHLKNFIDDNDVSIVKGNCAVRVVKNHKSYLQSTNIQRNIRVLLENNTISVASIFDNTNDCYDIVFVKDCINIKKVMIDLVRLERKEEAFKNAVASNDVYNFIDYDTITTKKLDIYLYAFDFILASVVSYDKTARYEDNISRYMLFIDKMTQMLHNVDIEVKSFSDLQVSNKSLYLILFSCYTELNMRRN